MPKLIRDTDARETLVLVAAAVAALAASVAAAVAGELLPALLCVLAAAAVLHQLRRAGSVSLTDRELDQVRAAELALAEASSTHEAAEELAQHAAELLGARSAVVLIEGIGDTVRVATGPTQNEDVYGSGSRMRLLDDAGLPCGSIAVSARADGRAYGPRHERILDALAERVSASLHRLRLLADVRDEERKLADLIGASSDGIFSVGSDLRVRLWNPAMEATTGVRADDAVDRHITESFRPLDADGSPRYGSGDPGRSGTAVDAVLVSIDVDDEQRWLTCSYAPLPDGGYVVIARDDTERKKLQDDKDGWIAQVSHELRTPLTPLKGFIHTLSRRDAELDGADRSRIYEIMMREEQRLEDLVNALLRSTQLDQNDVVVVPVPVDWYAVVDEVVDETARRDPSRSIVFDAGTNRQVLADEGIARAALAGLLSNALKYTDSPSPIEVETLEEGGEIVTSVIDHGPGIPRGDRERVFDKFTRLGNHLTRPQQGVGLGLYITRRSIEKLGGRIWIESTPGGGATFRFTLPIARRGAATSPQRRRRRPMRAAEPTR